MSLRETLWKMGRAGVVHVARMIVPDGPQEQAAESWRTAYGEVCKDLETTRHRLKQARESAALAWKGPRVGVAAILRNDRGEVLFMKRAGAHGAGTWSIPGGAVERHETPLEAIRREVGEEVGLKGLTFRMLPTWTFNDFREPPWWVTLYAIAKVPIGMEPRICEPVKCAALEWRAADDAPAPLFSPLQALITTGVNLWTVDVHERADQPPAVYNKIVADDAPDACPGRGQCHGCMSWCNNCGDVHHVCTDASSCDAHRPATDDWIDGAILSAISYSKGRKLYAIMEAVWGVWDQPAAPISETRIRERYEVLLRNDRLRLDVNAKGEQVVALPKDHEWAPKDEPAPKLLPPDVY